MVQCPSKRDFLQNKMQLKFWGRRSGKETDIKV